MAAPTLNGTPATGTLVSGTSLTANLPSGIVVNERLILIVATTILVTITTPTGWRMVVTASEFAFGEARLALFDRVADGTEGSSVTVTVGSCDATSIAFRTGGTDPSNPIAATATNVATSGSTTAMTSPSVTTIGQNNLIIRASSTRQATSIANPASHTDIATATTGSGSTNNSSRACYIVQASPGATGTADFVASGTSRAWAAITVALESIVEPSGAPIAWIKA